MRRNYSITRIRESAGPGVVCCVPNMVANIQQAGFFGWAFWGALNWDRSQDREPVRGVIGGVGLLPTPNPALFRQLTHTSRPSSCKFDKWSAATTHPQGVTHPGGALRVHTQETTTTLDTYADGGVLR
jgi:hypothetical protein